MPKNIANSGFYRYATSMKNNDSKRFDVFAHANNSLLMKGGTIVGNPAVFLREMKKDPDFAKAYYKSLENGEKIVVKLHACYTGISKDGSGKDVVKNIAREISDAFPNLIIVAADGAYIVPPPDYDDDYVKKDKYRTGTWKYYEDGVETGNSEKKDSYSDDKYIEENNKKPKEYNNWGPMRQWFYDSFGM